MTPNDDKKSAATVLVEMARARYAFGISTDGEPFAVPLIGNPIVRLLRDSKLSLRTELARSPDLLFLEVVKQPAEVSGVAPQPG